MRELGFIIAAAGVIWLLVAFNLDTSVATGTSIFGSGRVENIGLIAQRQNHLFVAGLVTLIGVLLIVFGSLQHESQSNSEPSKRLGSDDSMGQPPIDRSLDSDAYRLWLADKYAINRNELFDRFSMDQQTFATLDEALGEANAREIEALRKAEEAAEQKRLEMEQTQLEEAARLALANERAQKEAALAKKIFIFLAAALFVSTPWLYSSYQTARAKREEARLAEVARVNEQFAIAGIKSDERWSAVTSEKIEGNDDTWCENRPGTLFNFNAEMEPNELIDLIDDQLGVGENPYESLSSDFSHLKRIYKKSKSRGIVHLTVFGRGESSNAYLCVLDR